jgi:cytochrome c-type biogenesis protein CcmH/NrfF
LGCHGLEQQDAKLKAHLASGMDHDQVIAAFVEEFGGQAILAAPIDRGFNRLAWLVPYVIGLAGLVMIAATARRWSRHGAPVAAGTAGVDPDLDERLDDELRNLD